MQTTLDARIDHLRTVKAERLAGALRDRALTPSEAARLDAAARRAVETDAGIRIGSRQTWQVALDMLTRSARVPCPTCGLGDPEGAPGPVKAYGHDGPCAR